MCTRSRGLPTAPERVGEVQLRHDHALERVGRLPDDDGVDVAEVHAGVLERLDGGLADQPGHRYVVAGRDVTGLTDPDDGGTDATHHSPSRTQTRFCCRHGP